ncbi:MAG: hypothetical protein CVV51_01990 [Spirochaetae bacterium HGW-Spirochaetae-7]|jgi:serine/threonine protein kinase|nr:MAG: hypothetical protein CVV51_01990 [Spirochaetae bacterium HGW-Spirochaetae-7]
MLEANAIVNGCYILRRRVGEDSFSEWWQASAIFVASNFLLRFIKPGYASDELRTKAFIELARKRITLVSPAILSLIEVDRFGDRCFIASEYGGHQNLATVLDAGKRFSVEHSCRLAIELAEGIGTFHQRGEAFGVLAPECIAVHSTADNIDELKILMPGYEPFFNLVAEDREEDYKQTWGYASPELKKDKPTDYRSDIYSLGVLLFRLLAGKLPYGSRSGILVRSRSASPSHVAAALARRAVPRELTTTTVRALRKNPAFRHDDIMAFITDLRLILDARRKAWMQAGEPDPIADLATLNLKKAKADAREIVRSLETANYFRLLSEEDSREPLEPIETMETDDELLELEELEADRDEDDDGIATETYVDAGYKAALERARVVVPQVPRVFPSAPIAEPIAEPKQEPADFLPVAAPLSPSSRIRTIIPAEIQAEIQAAFPAAFPAGTQSSGTGAVEPQASPPVQAAASRKPAPAGFIWRPSAGRPEDVAATILEAVERARSGMGLVRFIEEPAAGEPEAIIAAALESTRAGAFVVDLGTVPKNASIAQLVALVERKTGSGPTGAEAQKRRRSGMSASCVKGLMAKASDERPLLIMAHGVDAVSRSGHRLFLELAKQAIHAPLCVFLFFSPGAVPSWHVLSALDESSPGQLPTALLHS